MANLIQLRRGSAAEWDGLNPVLAAGEEGYELDTRRRKVGDGTLPWLDLPYDRAAAAPVGASGAALLGLMPDVLDALGTGTPVVTVGAWGTTVPAQGFAAPFSLPAGVMRGGLPVPVTSSPPTAVGVTSSTDGGLSIAANTVNDPDGMRTSINVEFDWSTSGTAPLTLRAWAGDGGVIRAQVWVNGQVRGDVSSASLAAGALVTLPLTLSAGLPTRVRIRLQNCQFAGLFHDKSTSAISPVNDRRVRLAVLGDSWTGGFLGIEELDLWPRVLELMMGADLARMGQGGTGYAVDNPGAGVVRYGNPTRMARMEAYQPQLVIVQGSQNDDGAGKSGVEIGAAATDLYGQIADRCPEAQIVVVGPPRLNVAPSAGRLANNDAVRAAAQGASNVLGYVDQIGVTSAQAAQAALIAPSTAYTTGQIVRDASGSYYRAAVGHTTGGSTSPSLLRAGFQPLTWITGTGRFGAAANDGGNADLVMHQDSAHLTAWGHLYFGRRVYTETVRLLSGNPS